jgi:hypothetical protein
MRVSIWHFRKELGALDMKPVENSRSESDRKFFIAWFYYMLLS